MNPHLEGKTVHAVIASCTVLATMGLLLHACSGAQSPDPKPALDFGQSLAVALCQAEAPRRGFDPALCQAGSDFLRQFVDDAARQFAEATIRDSRTVAASTPCPPFADGPAPVVPGVPSGGAGAQ